MDGQGFARWGGSFSGIESREFGGHRLEVLPGGFGGSVTTVFVPCLEAAISAAQVWCFSIKAALDGFSSCLCAAFPVLFEAAIDSPGEAARLLAAVVFVTAKGATGVHEALSVIGDPVGTLGGGMARWWGTLVPDCLVEAVSLCDWPNW